MIDQSDVSVVEYLLAVVFIIVLVAVSSFVAFKIADQQSKNNK